MINKILKAENECLREKFSSLENKVIYFRGKSCLSVTNDKMTSICRKLKHNNSISKPYTVNDTVHLISNENHWKFSIWNRPSVFFFQILSLTWEIMSMMMQMIWLINRTCQAFNIWSIVEYGFVFLIVIEYCISIL